MDHLITSALAAAHYLKRNSEFIPSSHCCPRTCWTSMELRTAGLRAVLVGDGCRDKFAVGPILFHGAQGRVATYSDSFTRAQIGYWVHLVVIYSLIGIKLIPHYNESPLYQATVPNTGVTVTLIVDDRTSNINWIVYFFHTIFQWSVLELTLSFNSHLICC